MQKGEIFCNLYLASLAMMPMGCTLSNAAQDALGSADSQALAGTGTGRHVSSATTDVLIDEAISGAAASATETPAETK